MITGNIARQDVAALCKTLKQYIQDKIGSVKYGMSAPSEAGAIQPVEIRHRQRQAGQPVIVGCACGGNKTSEAT
jgi:hypothetical protein